MMTMALREIWNNFTGLHDGVTLNTKANNDYSDYRKNNGLMVELINNSYLQGTAWVSASQCHMAFAVGDNDIVI